MDYLEDDEQITGNSPVILFPISELLDPGVEVRFATVTLGVACHTAFRNRTHTTYSTGVFMILSTIFNQASTSKVASPARNWMRSLMLGTLLTLGLASSSQAFAACTGNLNGAYGMSVNGASPAGLDKYLAGTILFDASTCKIQGVMSSAENNKLGYFAPLSGTYLTNADNTVTLTLNIQNFGTETYTVGYSPLSNQAVGIESDPSAVASIQIEPQAYTAGPYNTALVNGTWAASCSGVSTTFSDLNYFTLSGGSASASGNISGTDISNRGGQQASNPYNGVYAVLNNGSFGGNLMVAGNYVTFLGVVDNDLNEIRYFYNDSPVGTANGNGFDFCVAKRVK